MIAQNECSNTEKIGYKLEVEKETNERMIFTFLPRYKSRSKGETIQYGDDLKLMNIVNKNFLSVSPINVISPEDNYSYDDNPYIVQKVLYDPRSHRHTAYLGGEEFSTWKIYLYSRPDLIKDEQENSKLEGGDLVRIKHSELSSMLS